MQSVPVEPFKVVTCVFLLPVKHSNYLGLCVCCLQNIQIILACVFLLPRKPFKVVTCEFLLPAKYSNYLGLCVSVDWGTIQIILTCVFLFLKILEASLQSEILFLSLPLQLVGLISRTLLGQVKNFTARFLPQPC